MSILFLMTLLQSERQPDFAHKTDTRHKLSGRLAPMAPCRPVFRAMGSSPSSAPYGPESVEDRQTRSYQGADVFPGVFDRQFCAVAYVGRRPNVDLEWARRVWWPRSVNGRLMAVVLCSCPATLPPRCFPFGFVNHFPCRPPCYTVHWARGVTYRRYDECVRRFLSIA